MGKFIVNITLRRFAELFLINIILSILITILNMLGFLYSQQQLLTGLFFAFVIYAAVNIFLMRNSFYVLKSRVAYYASNYIAYFIFAAVNLGLCSIINNTVYTSLFAITKIFVYTQFSISVFISAVIFHLIMLAVVTIAPIGMDWVIMDRE